MYDAMVECSNFDILEACSPDFESRVATPLSIDDWFHSLETMLVQEGLHTVDEFLRHCEGRLAESLPDVEDWPRGQEVLHDEAEAGEEQAPEEEPEKAAEGEIAPEVPPLHLGVPPQEGGIAVDATHDEGQHPVEDVAPSALGSTEHSSGPRGAHDGEQECVEAEAEGPADARATMQQSGQETSDPVQQVVLCGASCVSTVDDNTHTVPEMQSCFGIATVALCPGEAAWHRSSATIRSPHGCLSSGKGARVLDK